MKKEKKIKTCSAPGCLRPVFIKKHGLCNTHATRYYRHGNIGTEPIRYRTVHKPYQNKEV